ncbi:MAG TPA: hypothetical protein VLL25_11975 [Acidimicrobiales bacterium]|nr:hypothetical protein [Acidimicrobiales bacterium]
MPSVTPFSVPAALARVSTGAHCVADNGHRAGGPGHVVIGVRGRLQPRFGDAWRARKAVGIIGY